MAEVTNNGDVETSRVRWCKVNIRSTTTCVRPALSKGGRIYCTTAAAAAATTTATTEKSEARVSRLGASGRNRFRSTTGNNKKRTGSP